eukprot:238545_1
MKKTNLKANTVQKTSSPNCSSTSTPLPLSGVNQSVSVNDRLTLDEKMNINLDNSNISQNNQTLTNIADVNTNQLNLQQIYAQHHCIDSEPIQLTPQQYCQHADNHTHAVKNILRSFFANAPKLVEDNID